MTLELLIWIAPFFSAVIFLFLERNKSKQPNYFLLRGRVILGIVVLTLLINYLDSKYLLIPLVNLPVQLMSLAALDMPRVLNFILCFLIIDFFQYVLHRLHHAVPILWRLHRLHHSDQDVDALTTLLHHPLEAVSSFLLLTMLYVVFDVPVIVILVYALVQGLHAGFTHFKILVPQKIDHFLRYLVITPNVHRLHHSLDFKESNANFGQILIIWDVLFGSYQSRSNDELTKMKCGIDEKQRPPSFKFWPLVTNPFR